MEIFASKGDSLPATRAATGSSLSLSRRQCFRIQPQPCLRQGLYARGKIRVELTWALESTLPFFFVKGYQKCLREGVCVCKIILYQEMVEDVIYFTLSVINKEILLLSI